MITSPRPKPNPCSRPKQTHVHASATGPRHVLDTSIREKAGIPERVERESGVSRACIGEIRREAVGQGYPAMCVCGVYERRGVNLVYFVCILYLDVGFGILDRCATRRDDWLAMRPSVGPMSRLYSVQCVAEQACDATRRLDPSTSILLLLSGPGQWQRQCQCQ